MKSLARLFVWAAFCVIGSLVMLPVPEELGGKGRASWSIENGQRSVAQLRKNLAQESQIGDGSEFPVSGDSFASCRVR